MAKSLGVQKKERVHMGKEPRHQLNLAEQTKPGLSLASRSMRQ